MIAGHKNCYIKIGEFNLPARGKKKIKGFCYILARRQGYHLPLTNHSIGPLICFLGRGLRID